MSTESMKISYPAIYAGTQYSQINFYSGTPDLCSVFYNQEENCTQRRFFITDANVASLECMQNLMTVFMRMTACLF